ncbi:MAG: phosphatase PAP2 family protein [Ramlibacter sp.]
MYLASSADTPGGPDVTRYGAMNHRPAPPRLRAFPGLVLLALALALFGWFVTDLVLQGPVTRADPGISNWFHGHMTAMVTFFMLAITQMHSTLGVIAMAVATAIFLVLRGQAQWLWLLIACVPGGTALNALIKLAFLRARPSFDHPLLVLDSFSFPSGHTAGATVWWGFFLVLVFAYRPHLRWRVAASCLAIGMVALTALSRVYLGVHYPSDVLAAVAEGCAWLAVCFMAVPYLNTRRPYDAARATHA